MKQIGIVHIILTGAVLAVGVVVVQPKVLQEAAADAISFAFETETTVSVLFVGDIMLDRSVAFYARDHGDQALFAGVRNLFTTADLLVGNLEGSMTTYPSIAQKDRSILRFTFDPRFAPLLRDLGFDAVSLANNHALDFGKDGYEQTVKNLKAVNVVPFGYPFNNKDLSAALPVKNKMVCLVGYHSLFDPESAWVSAEIKKLRPTCTYVVVVAHWGEEYQHQPTLWQRTSARMFIDLGADLIIGAHPHIVEPIEIYKNKAIFYSLGNFLFDQAFQPEVMRGLAVKVEFSASTTSFTLTPVNTVKAVSVAEGVVVQAVLNDLLSESMSKEIADSIVTKGQFTLVQ